MSKKIVCLIESLGSGGAERQMSGLAVMLKQQGYEVEVWTYYPNDFYLPVLQTNGVKYRYISEAKDRLKRIFVLRAELMKFAPDTVISYLDQACVVACIAKLLGAKFNLIVSERNTTQALSFREKLKFFFYRFADHIVPNSNTQTEFIATNFPHLKDKLHCITNFVDTDKFCPPSARMTNNPLRILTVARIMPQKNIINYIKAIKIVVDKGYEFCVDWYGDTTDAQYYDLCLRTIKENKLENVFNFYKSERDIVKCYHSADVFCLPSIYEGFPNVVCEAMSCGLPILCSNVCDNPSIVTDGVNGYLFNPYDIEDICCKIEKMVQNRELQAFYGKNREKAVELFSKDRLLNSYIRLL